MSGYYQAGDSIAERALITKEYFNTAGRCTRIEMYDSDTVTAYYVNIYRHETKKLAKHAYAANGQLQYTSRWRYNRQGQVSAIIDYDPNGWKTGVETRYSYYKNGLKMSTRQVRRGTVAYHSKYKYHDNGMVRKKKIVKPKPLRRTVLYDNDGKLVEGKYGYWLEILPPNDDAAKFFIKRKVSIADSDKTIRGLGGNMRVKQDDKHVTDHYIGRNCLLDHSKEYLNGELVGSKQYELTYY
jgi:hypothetical protein